MKTILNYEIEGSRSKTMYDSKTAPRFSTIFTAILSSWASWRSLVTFVLPMIGGTFIGSVNYAINQFWVSRLLGVEALAAIGGASVVMSMVGSGIYGLIIGVAILLSTSAGSGNRETWRTIMFQGIAVLLLVSTAIACVGVETAERILAIMQTPLSVVPQALVFLKLSALALPITCIFMFLQMAFRSLGDSKTPFRFLLLSMALEVVLNPLLISGFGALPIHGVAGAAIATAVAQCAGLVGMVYALNANTGFLRGISARDLVPVRQYWAEICATGLPTSLQFLCARSSALVVFGIVNTFGSTASAAYTGVVLLWVYINIPLFEIGGALSTVTAQNVGGGNLGSVRENAVVGTLLAISFTGPLSLAAFFFERTLLALVVPSSSEAFRLALHINGIFLWGFAFTAAESAISGVIRGTGYTWSLLTIQLAAAFLIQVPFAILLRQAMGPDAVWWSIPVSSLAWLFGVVALFRHSERSLYAVKH